MPLVDGSQSVKMIRSFEGEFRDVLRLRPRVPVIAVSASLVEGMRFDYLQSGYVVFSFLHLIALPSEHP